MSDPIRCPDCGHENAATAEACEACGFPLHGVPETPAAPAPPTAPAPAAAPQPAAPEMPVIRRRPRRPPRSSSQALSLWLVFGTIMAMVVLFVAIQSNVQRSAPPVDGSSAAQQAYADSLFQVIAQDSANVEARVRMGDLYYDTGNWAQAIVHYRAALRMDSSLTAPLVDLGVCYFNLSDPGSAERHFRLALQREPQQPVALFNLGIVHEQRNDYKAALDFFHRSLRSTPREDMRQAILEAMARVQQKAGMQPPPLPGGG